MYRPTIADKSKDDSISECLCVKHSDQSYVEYDSLHEHPHEANQPDIVQQDSHCSAGLLGRKMEI